MTEDIKGHDITDREARDYLQTDDAAADPLAVVLKLQREAELTTDSQSREIRFHDKEVMVKERLLDRMLEESQERRTRPAKPRLRIIK